MAGDDNGRGDDDSTDGASGEGGTRARDGGGELDAGRPLQVYGVDSLVAVELRSWLARDAGAGLSVFDLTSNPALERLAAAAAAKSCSMPWPAEAAGP